jgi:putative ubiquitin-RnfH superfamily antitoxin RatB of RatAB toxin-antitoxin module
MASAAEVRVQVAYATPSRQFVKTVVLPAGSRVNAAIAASGVLDEFPEIDLAVNRIGMFGEPVEPGAVLEDGDRVEIYRPLIADPRETRRRRAARGKKR